MPKVFISATSRDLKSYRQVVTDWARANGYEPVVQDEFPVMSDYATIAQMLREKLDPCDAVIHLAGMFYGFEPKNRPDGEARRSYTQLEFELGKEHRRQVFRFIARDDFQTDQSLEQIEAQLLNEIPGFTADEFQQQCELQRQHRVRLTRGSEAWSPNARTTGNEPYYEFSNHDELRQLLDKIEIKPTLAKPNNLPLVGSLFKGRDEFLEQLRSVLVNKPTHIAAVTAKQTIHGLGGVGKTRVAVEYAKRYSHEYTALLFITADSSANLQRNLANLCGALVLNLPEKEAIEQEVQVAAALRWLREHSGWFLIVDNVDTPEAAFEVETFLQRLDTGHTVITSRLSDWGGVVTEFPLDILDEKSAVEFLLDRTHGKRTTSSNETADAAALASELGYLPLALEQAGAFIAKHRESIRDYRERWKAQEKKVLEWHDIRAMKYPASVATTWQTSFDQLTPDGSSLINILCWLAPDPIPVSMIDEVASHDNQILDTEAAIADLGEYSLLKWTGSHHQNVEIHRLVQDITRHKLAETSWENSYRQALEMVGHYLHNCVCDIADLRSSQRHAETLPHAITVIEHGPNFQNPEPYGFILSELGRYLLQRAEYKKAEFYLTRAVEIYSEVYGSSHPAYAIGLTNLAQLYQDISRLVEAEPLMRKSLSIDEANHIAHGTPYALKLSNLGRLLRDMGRQAEAEPIFRQALKIEEDAQEPDLPNLARILNNLARALQDIGRTSEAERLYRRSLAIVEEVYGPDHPEVAFKLNNLAALLLELNRLDDCEPLLRRSFSIYEAAKIAEHPDLALVLNNLGVLLNMTKRSLEAEPILRRALAIDEKAFPASHPTVERDIHNLIKCLNELALDAHRRSETTKYAELLDEAELLSKQFIEMVVSQCKLLGKEHPLLKWAIANYWQLLDAKGCSKSEIAQCIQKFMR